MIGHFAALLLATTGDYGLHATRVADGVYVFTGRNENFTRDNGGNIANTGFIVGPHGVVVIDTGPSRLYGEQQRAAIATVTDRPIERVYITHAHPDHFLGNQAYPANLIFALPGTAAAVRKDGDSLSDNLYRLVGGWMAGTRVVPPSPDAIAAGDPGIGRPVRLLASAGHTDSDLLIYDEQTGTLFTGDLVFFQRAPTTPNADIARWLQSLGDLDKLNFTTLVPGHGPVTHDHAALAQTRDYLNWLDSSLRAAANRGLDMPEVMQIRLPDRFASLAVSGPEYTRSIIHLYPNVELRALPSVGTKP